MNVFQQHERQGRIARAALRQMGLDVDAVAYIRQQEDGEFAALHVWEGNEERVLALVTDPRFPFAVTRQTRTRIFLALPST
jgi:hypothetical protein